MITCYSASKINLTLDILARRADGYHELASVVHTIGLWDQLDFEFDATPELALRCDDPALLTPSNLCLRAAHAWYDAAAARGRDLPHSLRLTLHKSIPMGTGVGGGSGNAAATLLALQRHYGAVLTNSELIDLAGTLGADVPLFLTGGSLVMEGIGERIRPLPQLTGWVVLLRPAIHVSTPAAFRAWDAGDFVGGASTAAMLEAIATRDLAQVANALHNDLQRVAPECGLAVDPLVEGLRRHGALGAAMTGSGSGVYGLFATEDVATDARQAIRLTAAPELQTWCVPLVDVGVRFAS